MEAALSELGEELRACERPDWRPGCERLERASRSLIRRLNELEGRLPDPEARGELLTLLTCARLPCGRRRCMQSVKLCSPRPRWLRCMPCTAVPLQVAGGTLRWRSRAREARGWQLGRHMRT